MDPVENLPAELVELIEAPALCYVATTMPDGTPQLTQTWVDTDSGHVVINSVQGFQKLRNLERDPRITLAISDPRRLERYVEVRGHVAGVTSEGGTDHIEKLAQRYTGQPYAWYGGRDQVRLIITIAVDKINGLGRRR